MGGDVYTGPKFAIDAIAAGKEGAISIHRFVQPNSSLTIGRNQLPYKELDKNDISIESYDNSDRQKPGHSENIDAKVSFRDAVLPFTEEQVKKNRALSGLWCNDRRCEPLRGLRRLQDKV